MKFYRATWIDPKSKHRLNGPIVETYEEAVASMPENRNEPDILGVEAESLEAAMESDELLHPMTRLEKLLTPGRRVKMTALWPTQDVPGYWFGTVHETHRDDRLGVILKVRLLLDGENSPRWFGMNAYEFTAT